MRMEERVCVVENDSTSLRTLTQIICNAGYSLEICRSAQEFFNNTRHRNSFCIVFNVNVLDGGESILQPVLATSQTLPVIVIAESATVSTTVQALKSGAIDFLLKPLDPMRLLAAIVEAKERHQRDREVECTLEKFNSLTDREKEIFGLVVAGLLNKQIAAELHIAEQTTKIHRSRVMRKMGVQSAAALARLSERLSQFGCLQPERQVLRVIAGHIPSTTSCDMGSVAVR